MIKKLICFIWGHKFKAKIYCGESETHHFYKDIVLCYCSRCYKLNENYNQMNKEGGK